MEGRQADAAAGRHFLVKKIGLGGLNRENFSLCGRVGKANYLDLQSREIYFDTMILPYIDKDSRTPALRALHPSGNSVLFQS